MDEMLSDYLIRIYLDSVWRFALDKYAFAKMLDMC